MVVRISESAALELTEALATHWQLHGGGNSKRHSCRPTPILHNVAGVVLLDKPCLAHHFARCGKAWTVFASANLNSTVRLRPCHHKHRSGSGQFAARFAVTDCDTYDGVFAGATTCNAGSRSLAVAFRAQCSLWHLLTLKIFCATSIAGCRGCHDTINSHLNWRPRQWMDV